jgi:hypothetical protein
MNKYLLNICLLASIANVSAASFSKPLPEELTSGADASAVGSTYKEPFSPCGHHVRGGAVGGLPGAESTDMLEKAIPFPSALEVTYGDRKYTIAITPTMRVAQLKASLANDFLISGGHKFMFGEAEIMHQNVDPETKALITLAQVFSDYSGIVRITIEKDGSSPLQSKTATPAPQSGGTSPAMGGESPATRHVDGECAASDASLGDTPPKEVTGATAE